MFFTTHHQVSTRSVFGLYLLSRCRWILLTSYEPVASSTLHRPINLSPKLINPQFKHPQHYLLTTPNKFGRLKYLLATPPPQLPNCNSGYKVFYLQWNLSLWPLQNWDKLRIGTNTELGPPQNKSHLPVTAKHVSFSVIISFRNFRIMTTL